MKKFLISLIISCVAPIALWAQCASDTNLATPYAGGNGQQGIMFNITAAHPVTIKCFQANVTLGTTAVFAIYYKTGTYVGSETTAANWTLLDTATVISAGTNIPTNIPISVNLVIPAGQTYGFYITSTAGGGVRYTDGPGATTSLAADTNITIAGGVGKAYPFLTTFSFRNANVTARYNLGISLPITLTSFSAQLTDESRVALKWRTASESNLDHFTVERSEDGQTWTTLALLSSSGNTTTNRSYTTTDNNPFAPATYYRLKLTDVDNSTYYSATTSVKIANHISAGLSVYPNPATELLTVKGYSSEEATAYRIYNSKGQELSAQTKSISNNNNNTVINVSALQPGIYTIKIGALVQTFTKQ